MLAYIQEKKLLNRKSRAINNVQISRFGSVKAGMFG